MKKNFVSDNKAFNTQLLDFILNFKSLGDMFNDGDRNVIKTMTIGGMLVNVKSFRTPNIINKIVYRFFRKSKAQRSFEYAQYLENHDFGTPKPLGYFENSSALTFRDSYYASEHLKADLTYRELTTNLNYPNHEDILRAFTRFSFKLHQNGVPYPCSSLQNLHFHCQQRHQFYHQSSKRLQFDNRTLHPLFLFQKPA